MRTAGRKPGLHHGKHSEAPAQFAGGQTTVKRSSVLQCAGNRVFMTVRGPKVHLDRPEGLTPRVLNLTLFMCFLRGIAPALVALALVSPSAYSQAPSADFFVS